MSVGDECRCGSEQGEASTDRPRERKRLRWTIPGSTELARTSGVGKATLSKPRGRRGQPDDGDDVRARRRAPHAVGRADRQPSGHLPAVRASEGPRILRGVVESRYINRIQAGLDLIEIYELDVDPERAEESRPHRTGAMSTSSYSRVTRSLVRQTTCMRCEPAITSTSAPTDHTGVSPSPSRRGSHASFTTPRRSSGVATDGPPGINLREPGG